MPAREVMTVVEEDLPEVHDTPQVEVRGDEAVIYVDRPEGVEERKVKLPKTTWG